MKICFDLDETLCAGKPYEEAEPVTSVIEVANNLKAKGHKIIIYTARGMDTFRGNVQLAIDRYYSLTLEQLEQWEVSYDELIFGKPSADVYVDDKALNVLDIDELELCIRENSPFKQCCETIDHLLIKIDNVIRDLPLEEKLDERE